MISSWWFYLNYLEFVSAVCIEADAMSRWSHPRPKYQFLGHTRRQLVTISWHILTSTTTRYDTIRHDTTRYDTLIVSTLGSLFLSYHLWSQVEVRSLEGCGTGRRLHPPSLDHLPGLHFSSFLIISHHFSSYWCQKVRCKVDPSI